MSLSSEKSLFGRPRSVSRSDSQSSTDSSISDASTTPRGMPIHSRTSLYQPPPPPLPPPRYMEELDRGEDPGYLLADHPFRTAGALPTIKEGSSLRGGMAFSRLGQPRNYKQYRDPDDGSRPRMSNSTMVKPSHSEGGASAHTSEVPRRVPSPSNSTTM